MASPWGPRLADVVVGGEVKALGVVGLEVEVAGSDVPVLAFTAVGSELDDSANDKGRS